MSDAIGPSFVMTVEGKPHPVAAAAGLQWMRYRGMTDAEASEPANTAALLMGVCADLGRIDAHPSPEQLHALRGALRLVRKQICAGIDGWTWDDWLDLHGDYRPDEDLGGQWIVSTRDSAAWNWPLSRLRWCLRSPALQVLQGLEEGSERVAILDALQRIGARLDYAQMSFGRCA